METLELSVFDHGDERTKKLRARLDEFKARNHVQVQLEVLPWLGAWSKMVQIALYRDGPDISEMGSTWIGDFVQMNALRPYGKVEIAALGGEKAFLEPCWLSGGVSSPSPDQRFTLWGMPWFADVRVLVYRRDILEQAGIDPEVPFPNLDVFEQTLAQLQATGVGMPLVVPTARSRLSLQMLASWVWNEGGRFLNETGDQLLFDQPNTLRGLQRYFRLARFLIDEAQGLSDEESNTKYYDGQAAITMGGHWLILDEQAVRNLAGKVGVTGIPPVAFVGGSHLVVWKYSHKEKAALDLVNFLAGSNTPPEFYPGFGFPARFDAIENAAFMQDKNYRAMVSAAKAGRTISAGRLWGMMEKRLVDTVSGIWQEIFSSKTSDIDAIVEKRILTQAERLRMALSS